MKRTERRESPLQKKYRRDYSSSGRSEHTIYGDNEQSRYRCNRQSQNIERRIPRSFNSPTSRPRRDNFQENAVRRDSSFGSLGNRRPQRSFDFSSSKPTASGRSNERGAPFISDKLLHNLSDLGGKIDPIFAAAAAAAAMNAGLVPGSSDVATLAKNLSRGVCSSTNANSSAAVAAIAAAAMNAAALAAAFGGGNANPPFQRSSSRYEIENNNQTYRTSSKRRSSPERRPYNYRMEESRDESDNRRFYDHSYRDNNNRESDRFPHHMDHKEPEDDPNATRTLFVGNLPPDVREADLRDVFERYGILEDVDIKRPLPESNANAYAFLRFVNLNMAHRAKLSMTGKTIGQFACKIGYGKVTPTRCLWIGGLGPWIKYPAFAALVERLATPEKIIWPSGKNYAHILFSSSETAATVASSLRGYPLGGNGRKIRVDFTDPSHMQHDPLMGRRRKLPPLEPRLQSSSKESRDMPRAYASERHVENRPRRRNPSDDKHVSSSGRQNRISSLSPSPTVDRIRSMSDRSTADKTKHAPFTHRSRNSSSSDRSRTSPASHNVERPGSVTPCGSMSPTDSKHKPINESPFNNPPVTKLVENATSISGLASCLPISWKAVFVLKKSNFSCRMHIVRGDEELVDQFIPRKLDKRSRKNSCGKDTDLNRGAPKTPPDEGSGEEADTVGVYGSVKKDANSTIPGNIAPFNSKSQANIPPEHASLNDVDDEQTYLRISQRMKMDPLKLDDVTQRIRLVGNKGFCVLLAMPIDDENSLDASHLRSGRPLSDLINYLASKDAAGVVLLNPVTDTRSFNSNSEEPPITGVLHVLPPCDFAYNLLSEKAVELQKPSPNEKFLVILLIRSYGLL